MKPKKLAVTCLAAAFSIHTVRWVNALSRRGHCVRLITMQPPVKEFPIDPDIEINVLPFPPPFGYFLNRWHLRSLLKAQKPDFLHVHYASGYGTLARLSGFRPTLLSVWGSDVYEFPYEAKWKMELLRKNLEYADYVASTSKVMKTKTKNMANLMREIAVTPFGVNCEQFKPTLTRPKREIVVGTIKGLHEKYGVEYLIRAFGILARRQGTENLKLLIVGEGPLRSKLERLSRELGISHIVEFMGKIAHDRVPECLSRMSVFVAVSVNDSESFGVSVIEASACGIPVVVSDCGGLPEVVRDGITGIIVPKRDPAATADAIFKIISNPQIAEAMGKAGRDHVTRNYEWNENVSRMETLYRKIRNAGSRSD